MKIATAVTTQTGREETARELAERVRAALPAGRCDLCVLFASAHFEDEVETIAWQLQELLAPRVFVGTTAEAVIEGASEYEHQPAISLWAAHLPDVRLTTFHVSQDDIEQLDETGAIYDHLRVAPADQPYFLLIADPFTADVLGWLEQLHEAYPGRPAIGGMASAGEEPGGNRLIFDGYTLRHGVVGVALCGNVCVDSVVSQGCRPIGRHLVITKADRNVIFQLGGKPALTAVRELLEQCRPKDKKLVHERGLLLGRVINEYQPDFARGDFLIRNPIGFDSNSGAMAVNDLVRTGQTVQFHVRDGVSAAEDLSTLLTTAKRQPAAGALLFTCNGRGTRLFSDRSHDARAIASICGTLPLAGCFCAGEIGPIRARNFLHGHTASIGFFRPADTAAGG